tara:strand:+ start:4661 stop:4933 length:273 start_codon:yes stop_codon:yes gene_type:complete
MDSLKILSIILACTAALTFLLMAFMPKNEKNVDISKVPDKALRHLVEKLSKKLEDIEFDQRKLSNRIADLQMARNIDLEQLKFLTQRTIS